MTNAQKYKTEGERIKAFGEFCKTEFCNVCNHTDCSLRKQDPEDPVLHCYDAWLAREAEEEKPEPCFFCGGAVLVVDAYKENEPRLACGNCAYVSCAKPTKEEAIAAHNRVARAIRAAKEGASS